MLPPITVPSNRNSISIVVAEKKVHKNDLQNIVFTLPLNHFFVEFSHTQQTFKPQIKTIDSRML